MFDFIQMYISLHQYFLRKSVDALHSKAESLKDRSVKNMQASLQMAEESKSAASEAVATEKAAAKLAKGL